MIIQGFDPNVYRDKRCLCVCALVSRSWRAVALPYLFRVLRLSLQLPQKQHRNTRHQRARTWRPHKDDYPLKTPITISDAQLFFQQNPSLATNVRVVELSARQRFKNLYRIPTFEFLAFMRSFPKLESICLDDILIEPLAPGTRHEGLAVESLEIRLDIPILYDEEIYAMLKCFSAVEAVALYLNFTSDDRHAPSSKPGIISTKIKSLSIYGVPEGTSAVLARLSRSPTAKSLHVLSVFQLDTGRIPEGLQALLVASKDNLSSLTLSFKVVFHQSGTPRSPISRYLMFTCDL